MGLAKLSWGPCLITAIAIPCAAQQQRPQAYIEFGRARVSLGATIDQASRNLAQSGLRLKFLSDGQTALVTPNDGSDQNNDEGQVTFYNGRVAYAAFQFPQTNDAVVLAQELAGAIENVKAENCSLENFTAHGTGGGHTDSILSCGSKTIRVMTIEALGTNYRSTNVQIEIGSTVPRSP